MTTDNVEAAPGAPGRKRRRLFLSYSRRDTTFAVHLRDRLIAEGFAAYIDVEDIAKGEPWRERLGRLIAGADAALFLISPSSVASEICSWEINEAERLGKRILPVVVKETADEDVPGRLARLNFTFLHTPERDAAEFSKLLAALRSDADWVREHTRIGEIAERWWSERRPARLLLRGADIAAAEAWRDGRPDAAPTLTRAQRAFLAASRRAATRRRTGWIMGAGAVAVGAVALAAVAWLQREEAQRQRAEAELQRAAALDSEQRARIERDAALLTQSRFLADLAEQACAADDAGTCVALALEALPEPGAEDPRPYAPAAEAALATGLTRLRERRVVFAAEAPIRDLAVGPDGRWAAIVARTEHQTARPAVAADGEVAGRARVLDLGSGVQIAQLDAGAPDPDAMSLDVDRTTGMVAVGDRDAHLRLYEPTTGALRAALDTGGERPVLVTRISPDGRLILAASTVRAQLFDLPALLAGETGRPPIAVLDHRVATITGADFSADASEVAITTSDGYATLWRLDPDAPPSDPQAAADGRGARLIDRRKGDGGWALATAFVGPSAEGAPRGRLLFANGDGAITGLEPEWRLDLHRGAVSALSLSPDGTYLASASVDGAARLWRMEKAALDDGGAALSASSIALVGHRGPVTALGWTGPGALLTGGTDGTVRLWSPEAVGAATALGDYDLFCVNAGGFALDGAVIVTGCGDGRVRLWDGATGAALWASAPLPGVQPEIALSADGRRVAARGGDRDLVVVFDVADRTELARIALPGVQKAALDPSGARLATVTGDGAIAMWEAAGGAALWASPGPPDGVEPSTARVSPDGTRLAVGGYDGRARLLDAETGTELAVLDGHQAVVWRTLFTPDGRAVLTVSGAGEVRLWDAADGAHLRDFVGHRASVPNAALDPSGDLLATGGFDGLKIWRLSDGALVHDIAEARRSEIAFRPDGARLAVSADRTLSVYRVGGWEVVARYRHPATVADPVFSPDGRGLLAFAPTARLWRPPLRAENAIAEGVAAIARCLTAAQRDAAYLPAQPPAFCRLRAGGWP